MNKKTVRISQFIGIVVKVVLKYSHHVHRFPSTEVLRF